MSAVTQSVRSSSRRWLLNEVRVTYPLYMKDVQCAPQIYNLVEYTVYMLFLLLVLFLDYLKQKIKGVIQQTPEMKKWVKQYWLNPHTFIQKVCECLYLKLSGYISALSLVNGIPLNHTQVFHSPSLTWQPNKLYWRTSKGTRMFVSHGTTTHNNKKRD